MLFFASNTVSEFPWLSLIACILAGIAVVLLLIRNSRDKNNAASEAFLNEAFEKNLREMRNDAERTREVLERKLREFREESAGAAQLSSSALQDALAARSRDLNDTLHSRFETFTQSLSSFRETQRKDAEENRNALSVSLEKLREENSKKLDEMRGIVDEKLQSTLEKRIAESFRLVSDRLENVHKSLGEMQSVATNITDLKRVLTNVKTRGTWGEVQLGNLLESVLTAEQYARNVKPRPRANEIVEFAIRLPGLDADSDTPVWLPIDSKFPKEDYERLVEAAQRADAEAVERAAKQLSDSVEKCARDIRDKYIAPPHTTNFAILFVPTEGLYAEILRRPGLAEKIQREHRVLVAGPTTFAALLNSLQVGFQTLTIKKNSAKIAKTLLAVKQDFAKFAEQLERVRKKLEDAQSAISDTAERHRKTAGKLENFENLQLPTE